MGAHTEARRPESRRRHGTRDARVRAALDALRRIVQALRLSAARAKRHTGLSGAQLFVLQQLADQPAQSLNELAQRTRTHQSSVSTVVTRLVGRGLVSRRRADEDGRRLLLELTPDGRDLLSGAPETAQSRLIAALERLPQSQLTTLASTLEGLVAALGVETQPAQLFFEAPEDPGPSGRARR
ncbi:MAG: MarR family winged helix-turn-helix transcriptional regulator [Deltaproteobacteria bacterium]